MGNVNQNFNEILSNALNERQLGIDRRCKLIENEMNKYEEYSDTWWDWNHILGLTKYEGRRE